MGELELGGLAGLLLRGGGISFGFFSSEMEMEVKKNLFKRYLRLFNSSGVGNPFD